MSLLSRKSLFYILLIAIVLCIVFVGVISWRYHQRSYVGKAVSNPIPAVPGSPPVLSGGSVTYVHGGRLVAIKSASGLRYQFQDFLSTNGLGTDQQGAVQSRFIAYPFGKQLVKQSYFWAAQKYTFTGKEDDGNLMYFRARYLDQRAGRFISLDPIRNSFSMYAYGNNNPLKFGDPTGMATMVWQVPQIFDGNELGGGFVGEMQAPLVRGSYFGKVTNEVGGTFRNAVRSHYAATGDSVRNVVMHTHGWWNNIMWPTDDGKNTVKADSIASFIGRTDDLPIAKNANFFLYSCLVACDDPTGKDRQNVATAMFNAIPQVGNLWAMPYNVNMFLLTEDRTSNAPPFDPFSEEVESSDPTIVTRTPRVSYGAIIPDSTMGSDANVINQPYLMQYSDMPRKDAFNPETKDAYFGRRAQVTDVQPYLSRAAVPAVVDTIR